MSVKCEKGNASPMVSKIHGPEPGELVPIPAHRCHDLCRVYQKRIRGKCQLGEDVADEDQRVDTRFEPLRECSNDRFEIQKNAHEEDH
mmetsp:Transcript_8693/g.38682  ORF Transcript_8693/g.38682 Transcript_8693/m.38682 type:complete len:88 (-) Transcript_8693:1512-1775(-)